MGQKFISDKDLSRRSWGDHQKVEPSGEIVYKFNPEAVQRGIAQRTADALETIAASSAAMAKNFLTLQADAERYERWYREEREAKEAVERQVRAQKGAVTRLKKHKNSIIEDLQNERQELRRQVEALRTENDHRAKIIQQLNAGDASVRDLRNTLINILTKAKMYDEEDAAEMDLVLLSIRHDASAALLMESESENPPQA